MTAWTSKLVLKAQIAPKHGNISTGQKITKENNQKDEIQCKIIFRTFVIIAAYCVQGDSGKNELQMSSSLLGDKNQISGSHYGINISAVQFVVCLYLYLLKVPPLVTSLVSTHR